MKYVNLTLALLFLAACQQDVVETNLENVLKIDEVKSTTYKGTFFRASPNSLPKPVNITLEFSGPNFSGSSEVAFPIICSGTFKEEGSTITFTNTCSSTDQPSFTLDGAYVATEQNGELILRKSYPGDIIDVYTLRK